MSKVSACQNAQKDTKFKVITASYPVAIQASLCAMDLVFVSSAKMVMNLETESATKSAATQDINGAKPNIPVSFTSVHLTSDSLLITSVKDLNALLD